MATYEPLLPVAFEAMDIARELVITRLPGAVMAKGDRDPASELDFAVERAVRDHLHKLTPEIGFLGEEEGSRGNSNGDLFWTLDPIDGTVNFINGLPLCGTSLALVQRTRPVLGVIDLPFLGSRYFAIEHQGAYEGQRRLRASTAERLDEAVVSIGDYAVGDNAARKNRLRIALTTDLAATVNRVRMLGSAAIDLAWVADGKLDACIMLSNTPWDTAAGVLLAREAGAAVVDQDGSPHDLDSTATIAAAAPLAKQLVTLIQNATKNAGQPDGTSAG